MGTIGKAKGGKEGKEGKKGIKLLSPELKTKRYPEMLLKEGDAAGRFKNKEKRLANRSIDIALTYVSILKLS